MKVAIFGTGSYYRKFKTSFDDEEILYLVDNDHEKQGSIIDGKKVFSPDEADFSCCDYIVVLVRNYKEIYKQLSMLGIKEEKIRNFNELKKFEISTIDVQKKDKCIKFSEWGNEYSSKKVMIVIHELSRTGVPMVAMNLAMLLQEMEYWVLIVSLSTGTLRQELLEKNIDFVSPIDKYYQSESFQRKVSEMDFIILGTIVVSDIGKSIMDTNVPIFSWIHESDEWFFENFPLPLKDNIHYYGGGERVLKVFKKFYPDIRIEKLLYHLPYLKQRKKCDIGKLRVAVIGSISYRKAQDVFVNAIKMLPDKIKQSASFELVGNVIDLQIDLEELLSEDCEICYIGELGYRELEEYYNRINILVCPSRDDPMPMVVTHAMQHGIPCIVSDQVGQMEYIEHGINGYIFENENVKELCDILKYCIENSESLKQVGEQSKQVYIKYFSKENMKECLDNFIKKYVKKIL